MTPYPFQPRIRLNAIMALGLPRTLEKSLLTLNAFVGSTTGECWPSVATLAKRRGVTARTAQRHVKALKALGVVVTGVETRTGKKVRSHVYRFPFLDALVSHAHPHAAGVSDTARPTPKPAPAPRQHDGAFKTISDLLQGLNVTLAPSENVTLTNSGKQKEKTLEPMKEGEDFASLVSETEKPRPRRAVNIQPRSFDDFMREEKRGSYGKDVQDESLLTGTWHHHHPFPGTRKAH